MYAGNGSTKACVIAVLLALTACESSGHSGGSSGGASSEVDAAAGTGGLANTGGATTGGIGGTGSGGASASGGSGGAAGNSVGGSSGSSDAGDASTGGSSTDASAGGSGGSIDAGTDGGAGGESHSVVINGGPWPDSATATCSLGAGFAPCPAEGQDYDGQDGTYRINVPSYTATADTVTDSVTGLTWQRDPGAVAGQAEAAAYCDGLSLGGYDDWRLPSRLEFVTLFDAGRFPGIPSEFPNFGAGAHWTRTPAATTPSAYFLVRDDYAIWTLAVTSTSATNARCVRGPMLSGTYQIAADTVVDTMTGLEWQRSALDDTEITWKEALAHCEGLSHASHTDWRLPSVKELATLVDEAATASPAIDEATFGTSAAQWYWSSTPGNVSGSLADVLQTDLGVMLNWPVTNIASARCVRQAN